MSRIGLSLAVRGDVEAGEDLEILGRVEGRVWCDGLAVVIAPSATIVGDILARDVTVSGTVSGAIVASEIVDIRAEARVMGRVVSPKFILDEGASFNGQVQPQHLAAALKVARHRHADSIDEGSAARRDDAAGATHVTSAAPRPATYREAAIGLPGSARLPGRT
jgi:cytoskeletal protein CcmA (bactofilin family)